MTFIAPPHLEKWRGVDADIVISLLSLLKTRSKQIFEESAGALKKIDMPEFVHSLYLYHAGAISILGLKPAQRGLYELSETLYYLLRTKKESSWRSTVIQEPARPISASPSRTDSAI